MMDVCRRDNTRLDKPLFVPLTLCKDSQYPHRLNSLLNIPPARLLAIPPEYIALEAKFDA